MLYTRHETVQKVAEMAAQTRTMMAKVTVTVRSSFFDAGIPETITMLCRTYLDTRECGARKAPDTVWLHVLREIPLERIVYVAEEIPGIHLGPEKIGTLHIVIATVVSTVNPVMPPRVTAKHSISWPSPLWVHTQCLELVRHTFGLRQYFAKKAYLSHSLYTQEGLASLLLT